MSSVCCQREGHKLYLCMCFTTDSERSYVSSHKAWVSLHPPLGFSVMESSEHTAWISHLHFKPQRGLKSWCYSQHVLSNILPGWKPSLEIRSVWCLFISMAVCISLKERWSSPAATVPKTTERTHATTQQNCDRGLTFILHRWALLSLPCSAQQHFAISALQGSHTCHVLLESEAVPGDSIAAHISGTKADASTKPGKAVWSSGYFPAPPCLPPTRISWRKHLCCSSAANRYHAEDSQAARALHNAPNHQHGWDCPTHRKEGIWTWLW